MTIRRSLYSNLVGLLIALGVVGATTGPVMAGEDFRLIRVGLTSNDSKDTVARKEVKSGGKQSGAGARSGLSMRCWNYGRLVYDSPVTGFVAASPNGSMVSVPASPQKQIIDLRSGLCVIE